MGAGASSDALALAAFLDSAGKGHMGVEGYQSSQYTFDDRGSSVHFSHVSGHDVYLDDKGWLSDAPLNEWEKVVTDENGRVIELQLRNMGFRGRVPRQVTNLTSLKVLNLTGSKDGLGLQQRGVAFDKLTNEPVYNTKEEVQAFLSVCGMSEEDRMSVKTT